MGREPHRALIFFNADARRWAPRAWGEGGLYLLEEDPNCRVVRAAALHEVESEVEIDVPPKGEGVSDDGPEAGPLKLLRPPENDPVVLAQRSAPLLVYFHRGRSVAVAPAGGPQPTAGPHLSFG